MLDVLSYPVFALMWLSHHLLSFVLDPDSGITWSLSVILLVIRVRAVLFVPSVLAMPADALHALGANLGRADIAIVALPLVIVAGISRPTSRPATP